MKSSRIASFIIITIVYIIASIIGIVIYNLLKYDLWLNLLIADIISTIVVFIFSLIFKNASVYDPYWSVQPIVIVIALAFKFEMNLAKVLVITAISIWGIRLTANWAYTFKSLNHQDWRYTMLHEKTGKLYPIINFIGIHMVPTLIVYGCTLPAAVLISSNYDFNGFTIVFYIICILAVILQGVADVTMHKFRLNKNSTFNRNGVWKYSRHPNYLAEITMWWSVALLCVLTMMNDYYLVIGALANTILFLVVSIPMAEKNQRSRKEGFDDYKSKTRMLLPIRKPLFKKKNIEEK